MRWRVDIAGGRNQGAMDSFARVKQVLAERDKRGRHLLIVQDCWSFRTVKYYSGSEVHRSDEDLCFSFRGQFHVCQDLT